MDMFLRATHPSATDTRKCPCDLHVLSMPPAFALSQDQTLKFIRMTTIRKQQTYFRSEPNLTLIHFYYPYPLSSQSIDQNT
jgi:hypothetical protein